MNVIPMPVRQDGPREYVAAEVRAALARRKLTSNSLPAYVGRSQRYWYERLNAKLPFSVDDLAVIASLLGVPMSTFMPDTVSPLDPDTMPGLADMKKAPTPEGEGLLLPEMDSNHQPAGITPIGIKPLTDDELADVPEHDVAPVVTLADRRAEAVVA